VIVIWSIVHEFAALVASILIIVAWLLVGTINSRKVTATRALRFAMEYVDGHIVFMSVYPVFFAGS
jgi:hypothetical protein